MVIMIILLILCLPLILMLSLFTTTTVVSIVVDVPVTGIDVVVEEVVELDLDGGESFTVDYTISPREASNKDVNFLFAPLGEEKLAEFTVDGNTITPTRAGHARVIVETVDGGYRDSFDVIVRTRSVESITSTPEKEEITVGEFTGINTVYYPKFVNDEGLTYRVKEGESIATVSKGGRIQGIGVGTALIEVTSIDNPDAKSEFTVTVNSSGVIDFVNDKSYLTALDTSGSLSAVLNPAIVVSGYTAELLDEAGAPVGDSVLSVSLDTDTGLISYEFTDLAYVGTVEVRLTVSPEGGEAVTKSCYITRISEISIAWEDQGGDGRYDVSHNKSEGNRIGVDLRPLGANVSYDIKLEYTERTDVRGDIHSGESFALEENTVYVCDGGYISVELESTSLGVFLVVRASCEPSIDDLINDFTVTNVILSVTDENTGEVTVLDRISVVVF